MVAQLVFWVLAAIMFYTVAIWPSLQFAAFTDNTTVHVGFLVACGILLFAFWLLARVIGRDSGSSSPPQR